MDLPQTHEYIVAANCTYIVMPTPSNSTTTETTDADDDTNALIYILVVIAIYVFSLAFFFCKFLKNKQSKDAQLFQYLDEYMSREGMRRQLLVQSFRERLHEVEMQKYQTDSDEDQNGGFNLTPREEDYSLTRFESMSEPEYSTIKVPAEPGADRQRSKSVQFIDMPGLKAV